VREFNPTSKSFDHLWSQQSCHITPYEKLVSDKKYVGVEPTFSALADVLTTRRIPHTTNNQLQRHVFLRSLTCLTQSANRVIKLYGLFFYIRRPKPWLIESFSIMVHCIGIEPISHALQACANPSQLSVVNNTAGETRTHKTLLLRQVPIPVRLLRRYKMVGRAGFEPAIQLRGWFTVSWFNHSPIYPKNI
jgi:hypothetical protein